MTSDALAERLRLTFLAELDDQLGVLNGELLALEGGTPGDAESLASIFRVAHTLKGASRVAGLPLVESVCHALESLLVDVRAGRRTLGAEEFSLLFSAVDALSDAGQRLRDRESLDDSPLDALDRQLAGGFQFRLGGGAELSAAHRPAPPVRRGDASGVTGVADRRSGGTSVPPAAPDATAAPPSPTTHEARERQEAPPASASAQPDPHVRVHAAKLDDLLNASGELAVAVARTGTHPDVLREVADDVGEWVGRWRRVAPRLRQVLAGTDGSDPAGGREARELLDGLDAELRRIAAELGRTADLVRGDTRALARASADVGEGVHRLRTRPFAEAAEALPRVVRDVAAVSAKEIELRVTGGEIEADRAVLDAVREALLHLVRNAADHGIEPPGERERAGKPRRGTVHVGAAVAAGRLRVTVADDGRGLDVAAARAQLVERGLPVPENDREVVRALFEGGISTRREATAFSGRGVGLDVVRSVAARVRGTVDVHWTAGAGTTFTVETPITLATLHALVVRVGDERLAIPTLSVGRLLRVRTSELRTAEGRQLLPLPEGPLPIVSLAHLLGPPMMERGAGDDMRPVVLVEAGDRRLGVAVDELLEETELVIRPVERRGAGALPHVAGAALLADGAVALVLNAAAVVSLGLGRRGAVGAAAAAAPAPEAGPACILVVDDSITTRTLEQSVLEAAGYEVVTAVDGQDGWRLLQERGADLVLSDVEMPRMDGFALCETIRASKRFAQLPVVLVTSLEAPEQRARGLEAGADAYVVKSGFDQEALLATVRDLLAREPE